MYSIESTDVLFDVLDEDVFKLIIDIDIIPGIHFERELTLNTLRDHLNRFGDLDFVNLCMKIETHYDIIVPDNVAETFFSNDFISGLLGLYTKYDRDNKLNKFGIK